MTHDATGEKEPELVIGILLSGPELVNAEAVGSIERFRADNGVRIHVADRGAGQTALDYACTLQSRYPGDHVLMLHESVRVPTSFVEDVRSRLRFFDDRNVAWGVIGNAGITFPYFKPVCNMLIADGPLERFGGVLPAAHLDPHLILIHRDLDLAAFVAATGCPNDAPLNDLAGLAAWEAGKSCWICNLPVYSSGRYGEAPPIGGSDAWARFLATRYNNATFISSFGTIELTGQATDTKDYYYGLIEPALNQATNRFADASLSVFLFATYYDADVFDRCLMSIVSQFQRPDRLYIVGLTALGEQERTQFRMIVERYRHYLPIHWAAEDLSDHDPADQLTEYLGRVPADGHSLLAYDTFVLFPQAVRQICEFFQICLGDRNVLPITTVETSHQRRVVEVKDTSHRLVFFQEVSKVGFGHRERYLSATPTSILHFTFPNRFLQELHPSGFDLNDLGSCLPHRLLAEPKSFFLIERGAGYMSFPVSAPNEITSPFSELGSPVHLANMAGSLFAARSNISQYSVDRDRLIPALSYHDADELLRQQARQRATIEALDRSEHEVAHLTALADQRAELVNQQAAMLNKLRSSWHFKTYTRLKRVYKGFRKRLF